MYYVASAPAHAACFSCISDLSWIPRIVRGRTYAISRAFLRKIFPRTRCGVARAVRAPAFEWCQSVACGVLVARGHRPEINVARAARGPSVIWGKDFVSIRHVNLLTQRLPEVSANLSSMAHFSFFISMYLIFLSYPLFPSWRKIPGEFFRSGQFLLPEAKIVIQIGKIVAKECESSYMTYIVIECIVSKYGVIMTVWVTVVLKYHFFHFRRSFS